MVFRKTQVLEKREEERDSENKKANNKNNILTRIEVRYDCGFSNALHIRGNGAGLSWSKGVALKNLGSDRWVFETSTPFQLCEFKILINDNHYEKGNNHLLSHGEKMCFSPEF